MQWNQLFIVATIWILYFSLHSLLAANRTKRLVIKQLPSLAPAYRALYNLLAIMLLLPPLWYSYQAQGELLWRWHGTLGLVADGLALAAVAGFFWSLRFYDTAEFLGLEQLRGKRAHAPGALGGFRISPLHRFVRHPWYSFFLIVLWTRNMDAVSLLNTLLITSYLVVGSKFEERKLVGEFGDAYRRYQSAVPALVPLPWKYLDPDAATALQATAHQGATATTNKATPPTRDAIDR